LFNNYSELNQKQNEVGLLTPPILSILEDFDESQVGLLSPPHKKTSTHAIKAKDINALHCWHGRCFIRERTWRLKSQRSLKIR